MKIQKNLGSRLTLAIPVRNCKIEFEKENENTKKLGLKADTGDTREEL